MDCSFSFSDFPEDIQLCILSFLSALEVAVFACTSKRSVSLCRNDGQLWFAMCERRWGAKTQIQKWGGGKISFRLLYKTLDEWENLIGCWRSCGGCWRSCGGESNVAVPPPSLIFFEWGPSFLAASRVSPSENGSYIIKKSPFLWMGFAPDGQLVNFLDLDGNSEQLLGDLGNWLQLGIWDKNFIPVNVNFMGNGHIMVEENGSFVYDSSGEDGKFRNKNKSRNSFKRSSSSSNLRVEDCEDAVVGSPGRFLGSLPDKFLSDMYAHFANRTSPTSGGDRAWRRQRKREKERQVRRRWEPEHFLKVFDCSPTRDCPLQGLWKGICPDMNMEIYLVKYDDIGGIICQRVDDSSSSSAPVFWTSKHSSMEPPFASEEERVYEARIHLEPFAPEDHTHGHRAGMETQVVSRILYMNSSYDLTIPGWDGPSSDPSFGEGRIWQYVNGTFGFGFGFLRDRFVIDLKQLIQDGSLQGTARCCNG